MKTTPPISPAFRPDIQALRALAIALVVATHAQIFGLSGGYVGVDVFFVLSGYLITGLITAEALATRHFDALGFYLRRLKRLYPALLLVVGVSAAVAWLLVSPLLQNEYALAGQSAVLWLSNFFFAAHGMNYFSPGVEHNLFLHTWSLAVEEQFYLVWPWLILFAFGVWRWQGAPFSRTRLVVGVAMISATSFGLNLYWQQIDPRMDFYLMPSRIWEFGLGALVFFARDALLTQTGGTDGRKPAISPYGCSVNSAARGSDGFGLLLIFMAALIYPTDLRYPGAWALVPALGAGLFLLDAPNETRGARGFYWLQRAAPIQFLGNISYSLYLWHWPIFIIGFGIFGAHPLPAISLIGLAILLATGSYFWVEQPIRRSPMRHRYVALLVFIALGAGTYHALIGWQNTIHTVLQSPAQASLAAVGFDSPIIYNSPTCDTWFHHAAVEPCSFGNPQAKHTLVLFGDSVLAQWYPAFAAVYLKNTDWKITVFTKSACSASSVSYFYDRIHANYTVCDAWRKRAIEDIAALKPDLVVMGSTHYGFTDAQWLNGTRQTLAGLSPAAKAVAIMMPTPELAFDGPALLGRPTTLAHLAAQPLPLHSPMNTLAEAHLAQLFAMASAQFSNTRVLNIQAAVCPHHECAAERNGKIAYRDAQHLTASFARTLAPDLASAIRAAQLPLPTAD